MTNLQEKRQLMETQMLELADKDFKQLLDQRCKESAAAMNEDGTRCLCCCLGLSASGEDGIPMQSWDLERREKDRGKKGNKGKRKKERGVR